MRHLLGRLGMMSASLAMSCGLAAANDPLAAFMGSVNDLFKGTGDAFVIYTGLHERYGAMKASERRQAGQLMSMADAMFGRYTDADAHYADSFPPKPLPTCPSAPFQKQPMAEAIVRVAGDARVLMINESHSSVSTRAAIIDALPALRKAGFTAIALEALNPEHADDFVGAGHEKHDAYVRDDGEAGFYLREPVYAQLVNEARRLNYDFVAYEASDTTHDTREEQQAANLMRWIDKHPEARVVLLGGYSHIWKTSDWMAGKLMAAGMRSVASVDQIDAIRGCRGGSDTHSPALWLEPDGRAWTSHPERVDATVTAMPPAARGQGKNWLTLGGRRQPVDIARPCAGVRPCLLEARKPGEADGVPEDRLVLFGKGEHATLYVAPGSYVLTSRTKDDQSQTALQIAAPLGARVGKPLGPT